MSPKGLSEGLVLFLRTLGSVLSRFLTMPRILSVRIPMMLSIPVQHPRLLPGMAVAGNASNKKHSKSSQSSQTKNHNKKRSATN